MKIYFEDTVIEIKARYSWNKRCSKSALKSVLIDAALAYITAANYEIEDNIFKTNKHQEEIYDILKEAYDKL